MPTLLQTPSIRCYYTRTMTALTPEQTAWKKLRVFLSMSRIARELRIHRNAPLKWKEVPEQYVEQISDMTGIPVTALRPTKHTVKKINIWGLIK